jgi:putative membrane protein
MEISKVNERKYRNLIVLLSVAVPVLVSLLIFFPQSGKLGDMDVSFLPHFNGILNSATSIALIMGLVFIKRGNEEMHRTMMMSAFIISSIFLISYVLYHYQAPPTHFGGEGSIKIIYFVILITHIILAAIVVPLILFSIYFALSDQRKKHKKLVKWTFPIWFYVAITGVIVYLMISPYY